MITQAFSIILLLAISAMALAFIFGMQKVAIKLLLLFVLLCIGFGVLKGCIGDKVNSPDPFPVTQKQQKQIFVGQNNYYFACCIKRVIN